MPLPFIGNLVNFAKAGTPEVALLKWRRQYGPIFTYWLGNLPVVAIADYQKMVETVVKDADNYVDVQTFPFEATFRGPFLIGRIKNGII
jgi:cytochrome P450 family 33